MQPSKSTARRIRSARPTRQQQTHNSWNECPLCAQHLVIQATRLSHFLVHEQADCPRCEVRVRDHKHVLH